MERIRTVCDACCVMHNVLCFFHINAINRVNSTNSAPFDCIHCLSTHLQKIMFLFSIWMMLCVKFSWQYFSGQIDAHEIIVFYTAHTIKHHNCRARSIKGCIWYNINANIYLIESCLMLCVYQMLQLIFAKYSHFRKFCVYTDNRNEHHNLRVRCK